MRSPNEEGNDAMVYVLFEVKVADGRQEDYLARAASLKDSLSAAKGFVRSERFESLASPGKLLSLSVWESEDAVTAWRNHALHRQCQQAGRDGIFEVYSITVLSGLRRNYGMRPRAQAPRDSNDCFRFTGAASTLGPEQHALLFAELCAAVERADREGSGAFLAKATRAYAESRAARMRARAESDGMPLNAKTYQSYSEVPVPLEGSRKTVEDKPSGVEITTHACPWYDAWKKAGLLRYGSVFCAHFDAALAGSFGVRMEVLRTLAQGADCCTFLFPGVRFTETDFSDIAAKNAELQGSAAMPFDYHAAHLLHAFRRSIEEAYGADECASIIASAMQGFEDRCGAETAGRIVELEAKTRW